MHLNIHKNRIFKKKHLIRARLEILTNIHDIVASPAKSMEYRLYPINNAHKGIKGSFAGNITEFINQCPRKC